MKTNKKHPKGIRYNGYKSLLENDIADLLGSHSRVQWAYESVKIPYLIEASYTPDFIIKDGAVWIEAKGYMDADERKKFKAIKKCHPYMDIRFVFANWDNKVSKGSKMTYRQWAEKYGFRCANKNIPSFWLKEFELI